MATRTFQIDKFTPTFREAGNSEFWPWVQLLHFSPAIFVFLWGHQRPIYASRSPTEFIAVCGVTVCFANRQTHLHRTQRNVTSSDVPPRTPYVTMRTSTLGESVARTSETHVMTPPDMLTTRQPSELISMLATGPEIQRQYVFSTERRARDNRQFSFHARERKSRTRVAVAHSASAQNTLVQIKPRTFAAEAH